MSALGDAERFRIGAKVAATDGACGELTGLIIDPVARALTHLIVTPRHHQGFGRLVPLELLKADGDPISLTCTVAEFLKLDEGEEIHFEPSGGGTYAWPNYELAPISGIGSGGVGLGFDPPGAAEPVLSDRVPAGETELRKGDPVHAADGWIGSVKGLVVDPNDHRLTHVLLAEGHLWGRKQVAIPIEATTRLDDEIHVTLTKEQIKALPPVDLKSAS
jgi:hypothetical protein